VPTQEPAQVADSVVVNSETLLPTPLDRPLADVAAWAAWFASATIPILQSTGQEIAWLAEAEERRGDVDAHQLSEPIERDPLMCLRVLASASRIRARLPADRQGGTETITAALVMMGIGPFFREYASPLTVEARLADHGAALEGLSRVLRRAHRAADFALGFAVHRMDDDAVVIKLAAQLHDFAEMLLWCHAPALALQIQARQLADPALRSAVVQRDVLRAELPEVALALMKLWSLPELLVRISDEHQAANPQVRTVLLAVRLARHTDDPKRGWSNPAVPDDLAAIGELLNLSTAAVEKLVHDIDL
jgi:HD-like signal output (HDOD) protein